MTTLLRGVHFEIHRGSDDYPALLEALEKPPEVIYGIGDPSILSNAFAIVGARKATPYGLKAAHMFAQLAAARKIPIVSGGALGCDSKAHQVAVSMKAPTVVVLGGGYNRLYPSRNANLFQSVIDSGGAIISEQLPDTHPRPYMFRLRNRIIAGLARATLIVEAGLPSGTFSTADEALSAQREVLVVPGSIFSKTSHGANQLLAQGATPVVDADSFNELLTLLYPEFCSRAIAFTGGVIDDGNDESLDTDDVQRGCPHQKTIASKHNKQEALCNVAPYEDLNTQEKELYDILVASPLQLDDIVALDVYSSENVRDISIRLAHLELKGYIARFPDGRYGIA